MINFCRYSTEQPIYRDVYMKKLLFFFLIFSMHLVADAENDFSTVEERMTGKEFKETGLVKLSDQELAALNDWLSRHSVATLENASVGPATGTAATGATQDMRGLKTQKNDDPEDKVINGIIVGTFNGWRGKGFLFKLTNGMVWKATENSDFYVEPVENAEVIITKGLLGNWRLSMTGYSKTVQVKRIE